MANKLIKINQDSKLALSKAKNLIGITGKILEDKNGVWIEKLFQWADENIVQERTYFPKTKMDLLDTCRLSLRWNRLKCIPDEICNLKNLKSLELNNNAMESLPQSIYKLSNLEQLNLNINSLVNLPIEIVRLQKLQYLNIKNNKYLELTDMQIGWLKGLKESGCEVIYDQYKFNLGA